jgi:hypothetical protein
MYVHTYFDNFANVLVFKWSSLLLDSSYWVLRFLLARLLVRILHIRPDASLEGLCGVMQRQQKHNLKRNTAESEFVDSTSTMWKWNLATGSLNRGSTFWNCLSISLACLEIGENNWGDSTYESTSSTTCSRNQTLDTVAPGHCWNIWKLILDLVGCCCHQGPCWGTRVQPVGQQMPPPPNLKTLQP